MAALARLRPMDPTSTARRWCCRILNRLQARRAGRALTALTALTALACWPAAARAQAQLGLPSLENLPRPSTPAPERGPVLPVQVERWRIEAQALEHGDGLERDAVRAAQLYCRASRYGDAVAQFSLAWMLTNSRGIERDEAQAAHLFAAAAEQGLAQAQNMLARMGTPQGPPPACLRQPEGDRAVLAAAPASEPSAARARADGRAYGGQRAGAAQASPDPPLAPPANAPEAIVRFVHLLAPEYRLPPQLVLAVMAVESNFDAHAQSPKQAFGLMQLLPETAARFGVRNPKDPVQNIRGGMAYLRWLLAYFEGDIGLACAAYNAGERAVERYLGVPPYAETRLYVRKVSAAIGGQRRAAYDERATPPSPVMPLLRTPGLR